MSEWTFKTLCSRPLLGLIRQKTQPFLNDQALCSQILSLHQSTGSLLPWLLSDIVASHVLHYFLALLSFSICLTHCSSCCTFLCSWVASHLPGLFCSSALQQTPQGHPGPWGPPSPLLFVHRLWCIGIQSPHLSVTLLGKLTLTSGATVSPESRKFLEFVSLRVAHSQRRLAVSFWKPEAWCRVGTALRHAWHSWSHMGLGQGCPHGYSWHWAFLISVWLPTLPVWILLGRVPS